MKGDFIKFLLFIINFLLFYKNYIYFLTINFREQKLDSETQKHYKNAAKLFNKKPQTGIDHLKEIKLIQGNPIEVAKFLHTGEGLDKTAIGNYLGEPYVFFSIIILFFYFIILIFFNFF